MATKRLDSRWVLGAAALLMLVGVSVGDDPPVPYLPPIVGSLLMLAGAGLLVWGSLLWRDQAEHVFDERFELHRLKSTRLATVVGLLSMVAWFGYQAWAHEVYHWHLVVIGAVIAVVKMGAMAYYRLTD